MTATVVQMPRRSVELHSVEAEQALLGALMQDNRLLDEVGLMLEPQDFYEPLHGRLYEDMLRRHDAGEQVNPSLLWASWQGDALLAEVGGVQYLVTLSCNTAALFGVRDFAKQILELADLRRMRDGLRQAIDKIDQGEAETAAKIADGVEATLFAAQTPRGSNAVVVSAAEGARAAMDRIRAVKAAGRIDGVLVGTLPDINGLLGPLRPAEVTILAGRPSMGKSAVALALARGAAQSGHGTTFFSLEMSSEELMNRMLADVSFTTQGDGPTYTQIQNVDLTEPQIARLDQISEHIAGLPLIVHDQPAMRLGEMSRAIRRYKRRLEREGRALELVVVDYLQLAEPDEKSKGGNQQYQDVTRISKGLKALAKRLGVHVVALAQVSRNCEARDDKRPQLADLRDSGAIEQDADNVLFVFREEYYLDRETPKPAKADEHAARLHNCKNRLELICAKRRNGPIGRKLMWFVGSHQAVRGEEWRWPR